ncbi:HlyD family type I secretion periplasmic adaptor subunit [Marinimicrococcus flavescens]|uniref:Membrane fusion protein (MFP) family protein n=1 Tax=Marinimicrococcus flavescens TaxID=3031815 RepID=A0AAP3XRM2_9PROT|nr:HlyD family type I secretion periplasmic adaptor subunit [Marinimicrococcus flavescens]
MRPIGRLADADTRALLQDASSPLAGVLLGLVALILVAGFGWAAWAEVEEIVRAQGRVEPAGRVKLVNHARGGRVAEVMVREGDQVTAGAPLLRLDPDVREPEHAELLGRWQVRTAEVARLESEAEGTPLAVDPAVVTARPDLVEAEAGLLQARAAALAGRRETLTQAIETRRGAVREALAGVAQRQNGLKLLRQQAEAVSELTERGFYPRIKHTSMQKEVADGEGELERAKAAAAAARAALAESESRLAGLETEWKSEVLAELARARADRDRLREQLRAQDVLLEGMLLRAPVDGIVQDLAVAGPGQAVGANETLLRIVPSEEGLVVEARVANEDIGRLREGLTATVKVHAYDFLRFGSLSGRIARIAADAVPEPLTGNLSYPVTVVTDTARLGAAPGELEIAPGMVVDVELTVGERTILSYLTDRLFRTGEAAFREG